MDVTENYTAANPQSHLYGDVHFYTITGDVWDWRRYPSAKFVSEYGFQSWTSFKILKTVISSEDLNYPLDDALKHREHLPGGLEALDKMIELQLPLPTAGGENKLIDHIYVTQIFQAMAIKIESEFYRRNREIKPNGEGHTMGALYWQLNDIWPTISWSSLEYAGKWKILHYYAKKFFANLLVDAIEEDEQLKVFLVRDDHRQEVDKFKLHIEVFNWASLTPAHVKHVDIEVQPFSVNQAHIEPTKDLLTTAKCPSRAHCFIQVSLWQSEVEKAKNFLLLDKPKNAIGLQKANIQVKSITGPAADELTFTIQLETDHVAAWVWLDLIPQDRWEILFGEFSDNGFMLTNQTVTLTLKLLKTGHKKEDIAKVLVIKSLKDVE